MIYRTSNLLLVVLLTALTTTSNAQVFSRKVAKSEVPPQFVLVQLNTYTNRLEIYSKRKDKSDYNQVLKDGAEVRKKMIMDFQDNFTFCQYYFYIDTNASRIKNKDFSGVLLDNELQSISNASLPSPNKSYKIIVLGYNVATTEDYGSNKSKDLYSNAYSIGTQRQRLMVLNPDFTRVKHPEPNGLNNTGVGKSKKRKSEYAYSSEKLEIYYKARAKQLSWAMEKFYLE